MPFCKMPRTKRLSKSSSSTLVRMSISRCPTQPSASFERCGRWRAYGGFLTGREAARLMTPRERGCIFFTDTTASPRGGVAMPLSQVRNLVCVLSRKVRPES